MDDQLNEYLQLLAKETVVETHAKGFTYLHHGLMPRLLEAGKIKGFDKELLATCWTRVGAIYALNEAPNRSIECLRKALVLNTLQKDALELIVDQLILIGNYHEAFRFINQLMDIEPDNMELITKRQRIQDDMNYDSQPQLQSGNLVWLLNEQLATEQFNSVISTVLDTEMDNVILLKKLACAYAAVGHDSNYLQVLETIKRLNRNVKFDYVDLFYKPIN